MKTLQERFWSKVSVADPDECWLWSGARRGKYGNLATDDGSGAWRGRVDAHRVSYLLAHGEIPNGMAVLHRCDVPLCVNPAHLFVGTLGDNNRDRAAKGRSARGLRNGNSWYARRLRGAA